MRPCFHPRLVNDPFHDPALYVTNIYEGWALLFDLGVIDGLATRDVLKTRHVLVSHTHMDHFCGFDRLLRLTLGRRESIALYGPAGFLENVAGKLAGYTWNLVDNFQVSLDLHVTEVRSDGMDTRVFRCQDRFCSTGSANHLPFTGRVIETPSFSVETAILDHGIPSLGFCLRERFHVNILREALDRLGLEIGPWVGDFKAALYAGKSPDSEFCIVPKRSGGVSMSMRLGDLARQAAVISPGQQIAYVADAGFNRTNRNRIVELARGADHLFIAATFLDADRKIATRKRHLTARQAGELAARAKVRRFSLFHHSPRYGGRTAAFETEARRAYREAVQETK
jgi:ribonuclease Z